MADETRDRVLNAAGPIFAREGFDGATVREICAAADVNLASVNYHFGGKETLYLETVKLAHEQKTIASAPPRTSSSGHAGRSTACLCADDAAPSAGRRRVADRTAHPRDDSADSCLQTAGRRLHSAAVRTVARHRRRLCRLPSTSETVRQQLAFSVVGQCLHYRVAGGFVSLLMKPKARAELLDVDELADQITRFSIAALTNWSQPDATPTTSQQAASTRRSKRRATSPIPS